MTRPKESQHIPASTPHGKLPVSAGTTAALDGLVNIPLTPPKKDSPNTEDSQIDNEMWTLVGATDVGEIMDMTGGDGADKPRSPIGKVWSLFR